MHSTQHAQRETHLAEPKLERALHKLLRRDLQFSLGGERACTLMAGKQAAAPTHPLPPIPSSPPCEQTCSPHSCCTAPACSASEMVSSRAPWRGGRGEGGGGAHTGGGQRRKHVNARRQAGERWRRTAAQDKGGGGGRPAASRTSSRGVSSGSEALFSWKTRAASRATASSGSSSASTPPKISSVATSSSPAQ